MPNARSPSADKIPMKLDPPAFGPGDISPINNRSIATTCSPRLRRSETSDWEVFLPPSAMVSVAAAFSGDAIAFNQGQWLKDMPSYVDVAYAFEINTYQGRQSLQLNIRDIKASEQA